ncbi:uncharacterized protein B0I36DRAFT_367341 [Microdochium trichocladiopsis]|uniref:BTB domain-containing protein n=1 Tax=Microdochium trichocladiopsis TaxID=1682393 RepID=A0A9P8XYF9_9PEZI|nr:uncharacterized protein B0I36DRAFT_367341 [Microdochium trichocladiopsis]KAH7020858.1 hypothetical protein B0I36DRAFT_367341 [Microdochium trichocladiopsis]
MSHLLWKFFWENDVDKFRRHLAVAGSSQNYGSKTQISIGSPGASANSPRPSNKTRKVSGPNAVSSPAAAAASSKAAGHLGKADINCRDHAGLTILHRIASSTSPTAIEFAEALLNHTAVDIYAQDAENGWNALHRALYAGNISIARLLLDKERRDLVDSLGATTTKIGQLIKTKDMEGNSPFDVYNASIALRTLKVSEENNHQDSDSDAEITTAEDSRHHSYSRPAGLGEEVFTFGTNHNLTLGLGDEDDRQFPERILLNRPEHLIRHFYDVYLQQRKPFAGADESSSGPDSEVPALIANRPLVIQDVIMSKLHTAVLTSDPISNLYICGVGRGGRLGLGDENTQFSFKPVQGGLADRKVAQVALGQNHSLAVTTTGELWAWGSNTHSQLGYVVPTPAKPDEEPCSLVPRQVFGSMKKETVLGVAASSIHSVAHTGTSLFCWGKNIGQLALMDADSRSLDVQAAPRKVAATLLANHSSILMVSAIDRATTCLFEDYTVCVFTSYGYNMIRFSFQDAFANSPLQRSYGVSRPDPGAREIHYITSGGDTIAALTGSGDLYTSTVKNTTEGGSATSTTNPSKIKDAITNPQCVWNSRKDEAKSVTVGEDGAVMISTQSGAVWRRVKRTKAKDTRLAKGIDGKRRDIKWQRVPYITDIVAVRSSTHGAYAAIRKDCDVTRDQIEVDEQNLWDDIEPMLPLRGFKAQNSRHRENKDTWRFQDPEVLQGRVDSLGYEVLTSTDLEEDLVSHFQTWAYKNEPYGAVLRSSAHPGVQIPVHPWILTARSSILRTALQRCREIGFYEIPDLLSISHADGQIVIEFSNGIDLITLINLVVYLYRDRVVPAWNFTRQSPPLAYRYRQIRNELMKVAKELNIMKLEAAVRIQSSPPRSMASDFQTAIEDPTFFEDGDAILELDGDEIPVHSAFLCQRCPWFQGLFNGRSRGMWLDGRRAESEQVRIDLTHMDPESFHYVLQYLYSDAGDSLFDEVIAESIDDFSELVMDVMSIANELMLDRLSQICQKILGRFVTTRNISILLNLISPCTVTEFKDKGLEYICLQMESMLENHLLDELDPDLLRELDDVVRDNQLSRCPFVRSGRTEILLHDRYPDLAQDIEEERQIRVKELAYKSVHKEEEKKLSSSFRTRFGSLDDLSGISPTPDRRQRASRTPRNEPFSPSLRPKDSHADLIFDMEDEESLTVTSPQSPGGRASSNRNVPRDGALFSTIIANNSLQRTGDAGRNMAMSPEQNVSNQDGNLDPRTPPTTVDRRSSSTGSPWASSTMPTARLDLRQVLAEPKAPQSALSAGLAAQQAETSAKGPLPQKISQKERKRRQQQQAEELARQEESAKAQPHTPWTTVGDKKDAPWKKAAPAPPITSLKSMLESDLAPSASALVKPLVAAEASSSSSTPRRTASPDTRFPGQKTNSSSNTPQQSSSQLARAEAPPLVPHSKSYIKKAPKPDQELGLGLAEIIGQQQREQQSVREAVAKRSLQEIQQEQEFQEWWDQESRRMQEEEQARFAAAKKASEGGGGARRGRGGKSRGGGRRGGAGESVQTTESSSAPANTRPEGGNDEKAAKKNSDGKPSRGRGRGGRGRGDSGGGSKSMPIRQTSKV